MLCVEIHFRLGNCADCDQKTAYMFHDDSAHYNFKWRRCGKCLTRSEREVVSDFVSDYVKNSILFLSRKPLNH